MAASKKQKEKLYTIGEVSKICSVSKKALRFYDEIGIISPDEVSESNHYRYYSRRSLLNLTILKYYKQMGFKLEEMRELLHSEEYRIIERGFLAKINELQEEQAAVNVKLRSVTDWYDLLLEAQTVIEHNAREVSVKFIPPKDYGFMDQDFIADEMEAVINLEWTDYLENGDNEITGAVNIIYPSWRERLAGTCKRMRIMQEIITPRHPEQLVRMGGGMMLTCYHIGSYDTLQQTYDKMEAYAREHGYKLAEDCWERYVTDCWTTTNPAMYVTEVRIGIMR